MMLQPWIQQCIPHYVHITVIQMYLYREVCKQNAVVDHVYHLQSFQLPMMSILHDASRGGRMMLAEVVA